jgi:hypothetical protein
VPLMLKLPPLLLRFCGGLRLEHCCIVEKLVFFFFFFFTKVFFFFFFTNVTRHFG